jgi:hypothetical protein
VGVTAYWRNVPAMTEAKNFSDLFLGFRGSKSRAAPNELLARASRANADTPKRVPSWLLDSGSWLLTDY